MSLAELQAMFGRLCIDEAFREWFALAPDAAGAKYKLTRLEKSVLRELDLDSLRSFSRSLLSKYERSIETPFELSRILLKDRLNFLYSRYYDLHPPQPGVSREVWSVSFGNFLLQTLAADGEASTLARDVCRYECAVNELRVLSVPQWDRPARDDNSIGEARVYLAPGTLVRRFDHDIPAIAISLLRDPNIASSIQPKVTTVVFRKPSNTIPPQMFYVSEGTADLLEMCADGIEFADLRNAFIGDQLDPDPYTEIDHAVENALSAGLIVATNIIR
ncbi:hypothetical protein [Streptomyces sp. NPDC056069]|uniref:hypothetical protein n=1 Tax=Streptomyces sp. NPDC056069 TaxID=3345702 RepID=UPI0035DAA751